MKRRVRVTFIKILFFSCLAVGFATAASGQIEGTVEKVWIDYGAKVKDQTGIRIHSKFLVKNALSNACSIQAYVSRTDGQSFAFNSNTRDVRDGKDVIVSTYNTYATKDGKQVVMASPFTPPYDRATYPDTKLFFPNWALRLRGDNPNKMNLVVVLLCSGKEFARSKPVDFGLAVGKGS